MYQTSTYETNVRYVMQLLFTHIIYIGLKGTLNTLGSTCACLDIRTAK